jgi:hypothetical protein
LEDAHSVSAFGLRFKPVFFFVMLTVQEFKTSSNAPGPRNKVKEVDTQLAAYLGSFASRPYDFTTIAAELRALKDACVEYRRQRPNSGREVRLTLPHLLSNPCLVYFAR